MAKNLQPGDTVILADGVWRDTDLLLRGTGKIGQPIKLTAQTPGKVILSGQSQLRLAGSYLEVSNLVFRDGWAPGSEVVSFRASSKEWATHSDRLRVRPARPRPAAVVQPQGSQGPR
ncbi:chondroitinase-B domain-containing protein [Stenotrophomonas sp. 364]|uniref:chondroitinase-B domain-containing protein n=1 Tax=Stenotrophomonas sp. 364 TaxID=2691571 RepID=UPI001F2BCE7B|nr:chondroitinase-B domain-containing protein [Stenotrophomonas sp. 364]